MINDNFPRREYPDRRRLGAGMSGTTWLVPDPEDPKRSLVLKQPREADGQAELDIKREARALSTLKQSGCTGAPGIVDVGLNPIGDVGFIVTEYLSPQFVPLNSPRPRPLTARDLLRILREALRTLEVAHQHGFTHGDLDGKPEHLWLRVADWREDGPEPLVKIMDWGNAQWIAEGGTLSALDDISSLGSLLEAHWPANALGNPDETEVAARSLLGRITARAHGDCQSLVNVVSNLLEKQAVELGELLNKLVRDVPADSFEDDLNRLRRADPDRSEIDHLDRARDVSEFLLMGWRAAVQGFDGLASGGSGTIADLGEAIRRSREVPAAREGYDASGEAPLTFAEIDRQARLRAVDGRQASQALIRMSELADFGAAYPFLEAAHDFVSDEGAAHLADRATEVGREKWRELASALASQDASRVADAVGFLLLGRQYNTLEDLAGAQDLPVPDPQEKVTLPPGLAALVRAASFLDFGQALETEISVLARRKKQLDDDLLNSRLDQASMEPDHLVKANAAALVAREALEKVTDGHGEGEQFTLVAHRLGARYRDTLRALGEYGQHRNLVGQLLQMRVPLGSAILQAEKLLEDWKRGDPVSLANRARSIAGIDPATARDLVLVTNHAISLARVRIKLRGVSEQAEVTLDDARQLVDRLKILGNSDWLTPALDVLRHVVDDETASNLSGSSEIRIAREWASIACIRVLQKSAELRPAQFAIAPDDAKHALDIALTRLRLAIDEAKGDREIPRGSPGVTAVSDAVDAPGVHEVLAVALAVEVDRESKRAMAETPARAKQNLATVRRLRKEAEQIKPRLQRADDLRSRVRKRAEDLEALYKALENILKDWNKDQFRSGAQSEGSLSDAKDVLVSIGEKSLRPGGDNFTGRASGKLLRDLETALERISEIRIVHDVIAGSKQHSNSTIRSARDALDQVRWFDEWFGTGHASGLGSKLDESINRQKQAVPATRDTTTVSRPNDKPASSTTANRQSDVISPWGSVVLCWLVPSLFLLFFFVFDLLFFQGNWLSDRRSLGSYPTTVWPLLLISLTLIALASSVVWMLAWRKVVSGPTLMGMGLLISSIGAIVIVMVLWPIGTAPHLDPPKPCRSPGEQGSILVSDRGLMQADALATANASSAVTKDCSATDISWVAATPAGEARPPDTRLRAGQEIIVVAVKSTVSKGQSGATGTTGRAASASVTVTREPVPTPEAARASVLSE